MEPNEELEDPAEDYVPALDEMLQEMQRAEPVEVSDDWESDRWTARHEAFDQAIRDRQPPPRGRRPCFKCERWVNYGTEEGETDPRCPRCNWQKCICGACGCTYRGAR